MIEGDDVSVKTHQASYLFPGILLLLSLVLPTVCRENEEIRASEKFK